jgi:hypothetical protein
MGVGDGTCSSSHMGLSQMVHFRCSRVKLKRGIGWTYVLRKKESLGVWKFRSCKVCAYGPRTRPSVGMGDVRVVDMMVCYFLSARECKRDGMRSTLIGD